MNAESLNSQSSRAYFSHKHVSTLVNPAKRGEFRVIAVPIMQYLLIMALE